MKTALLLKADGTQKVIMPADPKEGFSLKECYDLMNCTIIETRQLSDGRTMVIDEEGKFKEDARVNVEATKLYQKGRMSAAEYREKMKAQYGKAFIDMSEGDENADDVVGDVIVCPPEYFQ